MHTIKITPNLLFVYKRQIYQIAESNRIESKFFWPELECSSTKMPTPAVRYNFSIRRALRMKKNYNAPRVEPKRCLKPSAEQCVSVGSRMTVGVCCAVFGAQAMLQSDITVAYVRQALVSPTSGRAQVAVTGSTCCS